MIRLMDGPAVIHPHGSFKSQERMAARLCDRGFVSDLGGHRWELTTKGRGALEAWRRTARGSRAPR